jgi:amidase
MSWFEAAGDIGTLRRQLDAGLVTAEALALRCLERLTSLDRTGPLLNAVPVVNDLVLEQARELDAELAAGTIRGPLHGIPFTVKDSFSVAGLTMAGGSPAFHAHVARRDATVVERLRAAGALLIGKTTMPPMAIGGGQAGLYGRARSPWNEEYAPAAWHSGSSAGSGVAVAADLCVFGIGEETVSSGRSPASNNGLCAWTPSWGVVPSRGNWPLHPYRDTVVPHTRGMADLLAVADVLIGEDPSDVWHRQTAVTIPALWSSPAGLSGLRVGVPSLYVGERRDGVEPLRLRRSIKRLWDRVEQALAEAGAHVTRVPFPAVERYEGRRDPAESLESLGYLDPGWTAYELHELTRHEWDRHLASDAVEGSPGVADVAPGAIRPDPPDTVDARSLVGKAANRDSFDYAGIVAMTPPDEGEVAARVNAAVAGLDRARRELHDEWLDAEGLDVLIFPANGDIGAWDSDLNPSSARSAWADGAVFSHGNHVLRRLGIPTVTLPMGLMDDTLMPVGVTIAGRGWDDRRLLAIGAALEALLGPGTRPPLPDSAVETPGTPSGEMVLTARAELQPHGEVIVDVRVSAPAGQRVTVRLGDRIVPVTRDRARIVVPAAERRRDRAVGGLIVARAHDPHGRLSASAFTPVAYERPEDLITPTDPEEK